MQLRCGIVGLPNVGKSRLFNAMSRGNASSANFPFCTIKPNQEIVDVPDERLMRLAELLKPEKTIPTTLLIVDIAGLIKGASQGDGLGNQFLGYLRDMDALVHVVRCFDDKDIIHVAGGVNPVFDCEIITDELRLADLAALERRSNKIAKYVKGGAQEAVREMELIKVFMTALRGGRDGRCVEVDSSQREIVATWRLLTCKKMMYVANVGESALGSSDNRYVDELRKAVAKEGGKVIPICVAVEEEVARFSSKEQSDFLEMYGLQKTSLQTLIQAVYEMLDLITFFTAGSEEVRGWTIPRGTLAPQAAGIIHSDFEKNFIKAEVIKYEDYLSYGSEEACRRAGKMAMEGKSYEIADGDVVHFKCAA